MAASDVPNGPLLLRVDERDAIDAAGGSAPVPVTREVIGPSSQPTELGPVTLVHDRRFPPGAGLEGPRHATDQLWYLVDGGLRVDDEQHGTHATTAVGDLALLPGAGDGPRWRVHNDREVPARALVLGFAPPSVSGTAAIDVVRAAGMPRVTPGEGLSSTLVLGRGDQPAPGAVQELADTSLEVGVTLPIALGEGESALVWCLDGRVQVDIDGSSAVTGVGLDDTVAIPAAAASRQIRVAAQAGSRVLHAVVT